MSSLLLTIVAIAALCGPRIQSQNQTAVRIDAKICQVEMIKCVKSKQGPSDEALVSCMQEIK